MSRAKLSIAANAGAPKSAGRHWFVHLNGKVLGPLSTAEAEAAIKGQAGEAALFWWRGRKDWVGAAAWKAERGLFEHALQQAYYLKPGQADGKTLGELLAIVRAAQSPEAIRVWLPGGGAPKSVFEIAAVCKALGLKERRVPRVGSRAVAVIERGNLRVVAAVETVSAGGLGIRLGPEIALSGEVVLRLRGDGLSDIAPIRARVAYSRAGSVGLAFQGLGAETAAKIATYVRERLGEGERAAATAAGRK